MVGRLTNTLPMISGDPLRSSMNSTWDGNNITFPLHQPIYFDFSHDTVFAARKCIRAHPALLPRIDDFHTVLSTMNITNYNTAGPMPITERQTNQVRPGIQLYWNRSSEGCFSLTSRKTSRPLLLTSSAKSCSAPQTSRTLQMVPVPWQECRHIFAGF